MSTRQENNEISLLTGGSELVDRIEPMWLQLRQYHADLPTIWRSSLLEVSFEARRSQLLANAARGLLVVLASTGGEDVGYCLGTVEKEVGQVSSIFVAYSHRRRGVGHAMMLRMMDWFKEKSVSTVVVDLLVGNEQVQAFYATYGFHPRSMRLQKTNE